MIMLWYNKSVISTVEVGSKLRTQYCCVRFDKVIYYFRTNFTTSHKLLNKIKTNDELTRLLPDLRANKYSKAREGFGFSLLSKNVCIRLVLP